MVDSIVYSYSTHQYLIFQGRYLFAYNVDNNQLQMSVNPLSFDVRIIQSFFKRKNVELFQIIYMIDNKLHRMEYNFKRKHATHQSVMDLRLDIDDKHYRLVTGLIDRNEEIYVFIFEKFNNDNDAIGSTLLWNIYRRQNLIESKSIQTTMLPLTPVTMTGFKNSTIITTTTSSTGSTNTNHHSSSIDNRKVQSFISLIKIEDDFKPLFKGRIIPKNELNLTDKARKVMSELDYYDDLDNDGDGEDYESDDYDENIENVITIVTSTTESSVKKTDGNINNNNEDSYAEEDDIDRAVGGISGILEKLIRGPNKEEINAKSKPEDVYIFLSRIIQNEYGKSIKATIPRIYDYQFPISERISQRCFNSFAQFADRLRKHYIWPHKSNIIIILSIRITLLSIQ